VAFDRLLLCPLLGLLVEAPYTDHVVRTSGNEPLLSLQTGQAARLRVTLLTGRDDGRRPRHSVGSSSMSGEDRGFSGPVILRRMSATSRSDYVVAHSGSSERKFCRRSKHRR
jgi:hypothetical protein